MFHEHQWTELKQKPTKILIDPQLCDEMWVEKMTIPWDQKSQSYLRGKQKST